MPAGRALEERLKFTFCGLRGDTASLPSAVWSQRVFSVGCQKATENCSVHLLSLLFHAPECPDPEEPQGTWKDIGHPLQDTFHTTTLALTITAHQH